MFGYIVTDRAQLTEAERLRYRAVYCGLCRTLKARCGLRGAASLSNDMAFLNILLDALYEPENREWSSRCARHPLRRREKSAGEMTEYCADMSLVLAYHNAMDDWNDDKNRVALRYARSIEKYALAVSEKYPRQTAAVTASIGEINTLERMPDIPLDAVADAFGRMLGEVFVPFPDDHWAPTLRKTGENLGKFIYFMDAYEDADRDGKKKNYNPLLPLRQEEGYEEKVKEILTMFLSDAVAAFETLPVVRDAGLMRNVLYAGVWSKYMMMQRKKDDR